MGRRLSLEERFNEKWMPFHGCWIWIGSLNNKGYPWLRSNGKTRLAHRISWELFNGRIPDNKFVLHWCDNPACVNPNHLFLGTQKDNMRDCGNKDRHSRGERNGHSLLKEKDIPSIRSSNLSRKELAELFGVSSAAITDVQLRRTWRYL